MTAAQTLDRERHLRYWKRCYRSYLPSQYTSHDSSRMAIGFFIVAAFDILSPQESSAETRNFTTEDRANVRSWVLGLQHPRGGFCGSPSHSLPAHLGIRVGGFGVANIAATYFAILLLALVSEDTQTVGQPALTGVDRRATLRWLKRLQRPDGSFGELVLDDGTIEGGKDMRLCYLASSIRWLLRGEVQEGEPAWVEDIDVAALAAYIRQGQAYDGGVAESSGHESHAGYAYCAVGALSLLERRPDDASHVKNQSLGQSVPSREALVKFLAHRQFRYVGAGEDDDSDASIADDQLPEALCGLSLDETSCVGFNGRCNKVADTCYCWWVGGTLSMLSEEPGSILAVDASRNFLFTETQHLIGGFSKHAGGPPDIHHAYLGLAALATMGDESLKQFDTSLCVSVETVRKAAAARDALIATECAESSWDNTCQADAAFWHGKEVVWPRHHMDDASQQKLSEALKALD